MKLLFTIIFLLLTQIVFSQSDCTCEKELSFVINYYENNLASFGDNVNDDNKKAYENFKKALNKEAKTIKNATNCFRVLTYYVEFFKDNHSSIRMRSKNVDENNEEEVKQFLESDLYKSREVYKLKKEDFKQYPIEDIRGVYNLGEFYKIAIIPNKTPFRDYIGVILESKSKLWKKGQVKVEIKKVGKNHYEAFSYLRNHSLRFSGRYKLKSGILGDTWVKTIKRDAHNYSIIDDNSFNFTMLNDTIAYLRIPSFSGSQTAKIDSLYKVADKKIRQTPYLIIDVRNNGGGSDMNVSPLLPYIYTNPIKGDRVELLVTKDNLKLWKKWQAAWKKDTINYSDEQRNWINKEVSRMEKAKPNTWILRSKANKHRMKDVAKYPKSVAIIQNQYCGSSCETLLFWAKQSKKTILVGENSGGLVGYGENGGLNTPCFNYILTCTMTRYKEQRKYEAEGIAPDYHLNYTSDWIEQSIKILSEQ